MPKAHIVSFVLTGVLSASSIPHTHAAAPPAIHAHGDAASSSSPRTSTPATVPLEVGARMIVVELADTPRTRRRGLMDRDTLPANGGMWFELGAPDHYCFWMKNTLIPLSIAFVDAKSRIVSIQDMQPHDLTPHCPQEPVTSALEMNQGWFAEAGIRVGDHIRRAKLQTVPEKSD